MLMNLWKAQRSPALILFFSFFNQYDPNLPEHRNHFSMSLFEKKVTWENHKVFAYAIGRVLKRQTFHAYVQVPDPKGLQKGLSQPVTPYLHGWYWFEVLQLPVKQRLTALLFKCRVPPNVNSLQDQISPPTWSSWAQDAALQASLIA